MSELMLKGKKEQRSQNATKVAAKTGNVEVPPSMAETAVDFNTITPSQIAHLQRTVGNQAIQRAVQRMGIQRKMTLGPVGDKYEQEADAVAKQVVGKLNGSQSEVTQRQEEEEELQMQPISHVQRQEEGEELQMKPLLQRQEEEEELQMKPLLQRQEEEEELQMKPLLQRQEEEELQMKPLLQRQEEEEELQMKPLLQRQEEEELQMKPLLQRQEEEEELQMKPSSTMDGGELASDVEGQIQSAKGGGRPLAINTQSNMGQAFNADFSNVKVHTDSQSDTLNRAISARAFTTGQDIFFRSGEYNPDISGGQELLAHELTHVVQQNGSGNQNTHSDTVQAKFQPATIGRNAHLRNNEAWGTHIGPKINSGSGILVDDDMGKSKKQSRKIGSNTTWRPAVNVPPAHQANVNNNQKGYIRNKKITFQPNSLEDIVKLRLKNILQTAEQKYPSLAGHLDKDENIRFLLEKGIRYKEWNTSPNLDGFVSGFTSKEDKMARIHDGATYVADSLEHWRTWLYPERADEVQIQEVTLLKSDLHEEGLGVLSVKFTKPQGPEGHKFKDDTTVDLIVKPEDKSLEENLLGDKPDSAVNQINELVGLSDNEALATIKMACSLQYGSIVEKVKGTKAEDLVGHSNLRIEPAFHETLVFAFLAGIDDLHGENVYWHQGKPYLIDADNVLSYNQMLNKDNGAIIQSGFGSGYSLEEATKNKESISTLKNTVKSKILRTMIENPVKAMRIIDIIKDSVAGKEARVVPIRTAKWGGLVSAYPAMEDKVGFLDFYSTSSFVVREDSGFLESSGPGLFGTSYKNAENEFYDQNAEKAELKKDFDAGVIPFYTYKFDTGYIYHNGTKVYHGQTSEQAMQVMVDKFTPEWDRQWNEYMQLKGELEDI